jgi:hypothetical protein
MEKKWWNKIVEQLKGSQPEPSPTTESPAPDLLLQGQTSDLGELAETDPAGPGAISRWMQRRQLTGQVENYIEELAKTNEKLVSALEKLTQAAETQGLRFERMAQNQDKFVSVLERQGKGMNDMLTEMQRLTSAADHLIGALEALPKSSRDQAEKLSAIEDQLQSDGQTDRALLTSLDSLGRHVAAMARFAETQQSHREELIKGFNLHLQPLAELLKAQNRFVKWNFSFMIVGVLGILGLFAVYLIKTFLR